MIKLDIDTSTVEIPLVAAQLLNDTSLHSIVDHFYFEHHVHSYPISAHWEKFMSGSMKGIFELLTSMRQRGVNAHFWP